MPYRTPADPQTRPNAEGPDSLRPADHNAAAAWFAHVQAGLIGGNPPMSDAIREQILANARVMRPHPVGDRPAQTG